MRNKDNLYHLTQKDRDKRRGDRRILALSALLESKNGRTPVDLALEWSVDPTSSFRVLERMRKYGVVERSGRGISALYTITDKGRDRLEYLLDRWEKRYAEEEEEIE